MLVLIRAERDSLLKKNAQAKERLRDLNGLRKEKLKVEQELTDQKKKLTEAENNIMVLKLKQKDL